MRAQWIFGLLLVGCGDRSPTPPVTFREPIPNRGSVQLCESSEACGIGSVCHAGVCEPQTFGDAGHEDARSVTPESIDAGLWPDATIIDASAAADAEPQLEDAEALDAVATDITVGPSYDLGGASLVNTELPTSQRYAIPTGTILRPGDVLLLVRSATRAELESVFGPFAANVQVLTTHATSVGAPIINGNESFALEAADGRMLDTTTTVGRAGYAYERDPSGTFTEVPESAATPGVPPPLSPSPTPRITEWSDRSGTGQFALELVEISFQP